MKEKVGWRRLREVGIGIIGKMIVIKKSLEILGMV